MHFISTLFECLPTLRPTVAERYGVNDQRAIEWKAQLVIINGGF